MVTNISAATFPPGELEEIFSHLEAKDLVRAGMVCKSWQKVQRTALLWKNLSKPWFSDAPSSSDSWKDQYKVFHNWKQGLCAITPMLSRDEPFNFLSPNEVWELKEDSFVISNATTGVEIKCIDLRSFGCTAIRHAALRDQDLFVMNTDGTIFSINIQTGEQIRPPLSKPLPDEKHFVEICVTDFDIIRFSYFDMKAWIWKAQTGAFDQTIEFNRRVYHVTSTPNFLVFFTEDAICAIQKSDPGHELPQILKIPHNEMPVPFFRACGPYLAVRTRWDEVKVFKDTTETLELVHTLSCSSPYGCPQFFNSFDFQFMRFNKHRLCVASGGLLHVFNIQTGAKLTTVPVGPGSIDGVFSECLVTLHGTGDASHETFKSTLYDFRKNATKLRLESPHRFV